MSVSGVKSPPTCPRHFSSADEGIAEENENEMEQEVTQLSHEDDLDDLPWHHAQLIKLYGKKVADDIMNPKQEPKLKVTMNAKLRRSEGKGADQIWKMLRHESNKKLLDKDRQIPDSLKHSYGAFVRQLVLQKEEVPVKRNFYEHEDVPRMDHLLDRQKVMRVLDLRHKTELMGRSSKYNQDKTDILMYNNPLPDLVNASGEEGIERYLPSCIDDQDMESVASYKKWLDANDKASTAGEVSLLPSDSMLELAGPLDKHRTRSAGLPPMTFLTESEAKAERGRFSDSFKAQSETMKNRVTNPRNQPEIELDDVTLKPFRGDNAHSARSRNPSSGTKKSDPAWEPLTLNALIEYSDEKGVGGSGRFLNGAQPMHRLTDDPLITPL